MSTRQAKRDPQTNRREFVSRAALAAATATIVEQDWVRACKGGQSASSNFDFSGPLSEMVLMGNLAVRYPNRKLLWNGQKMEVTNDAEANSYVRRRYRQGWTL